MPLSEEQRRKIEENKQKALLKRQQRENGIPSPVSVAQQPPSSLGSTQSSTASSSTSSISDKAKKKMEENKRLALEKRRQKEQQRQSVVASTSKPAADFYGSKSKIPNSANTKSIHGKCLLISRERFTINISYQSNVIDIFKSSKTGSYNGQDRTWSFQIEEHDEIVAKLKPLKSSHNVHIDSLPKWVMETFTKFKARMSASTNASYVQECWNQVEPSLRDALMPFQREGVEYAFKRRGRILLADDMGLGKTVQALAITSAFKSQWPLLILCPSSMRFAWKSAVVRWVTSIPEEDINVVVSGRDNLEGSVIILSYDMLVKKQAEFYNYAQIEVVILDECHNIKDYKTARTKAVNEIVKDAKQIVMLSGTPALSRPIELYSQITLLEPKLFTFVSEFGMRYCDGRKISFGNKEIFDFKGSSNMEELRLMLSERFMIRRLKSDVLAQLPDKSRQMVILDPSLVKSKSKELQSSANAYFSSTTNNGNAHGCLLQWFHTTANAKSKAVCEYIRDLSENGRKFLIFAVHTVLMNDIAAVLEKSKVQYIRIDGSTTSEARKNYVDEFQVNDNIKVALLSVTAANAGITLTASSFVVFAELYWNPGILIQAEDRCHRIGQTNKVTIQYLVAVGTADDTLWQMLQRKQNVLHKAGLSKENFQEDDSENIKQEPSKAAQSDANSSLITDYFDTSFPSTFPPTQNNDDENVDFNDSWNGQDEADPEPSPAKRQRVQ